MEDTIVDAFNDLDTRISALDPRDPELAARCDAALGRIIELTGAPRLDDYRRVYNTQGWDWPGDDEIRRRYPVASAG